MTTDTKPTGQIIPAVLARLPEPSKDLSDTSRQNTIQASSAKCSPLVPLATPWQQRRLNLDARPPMMQQMANRVEAWCKNFARYGQTGRAIVLVGPYGCAKTHSLTAAKRYVRDVRMAVWPSPWPKLANMFACNWGDFAREIVEEGNNELRADLLEADVIFADDAGSEEDRFRSGAPARLFGDVLGALHQKNPKPFLFITTNVAPSGWKDHWDGRVEDRLLRMDADIVDLSACESYATWSLRNDAGNRT